MVRTSVLKYPYVENNYVSHCNLAEASLSMGQVYHVNIDWIFYVNQYYMTAMKGVINNFS